MHPWINLETLSSDTLVTVLQNLWNTFETLKTLETPIRHTWDTLETSLRHPLEIQRHPWNTFLTPLKHLEKNLGAWSNARRNIFAFYSLKINIETAKRRTNIDGVTDTRGGGRNLTIRHFLDNMEHFNYNLLYLYIY